jgi:hypothetical protein
LVISGIGRPLVSVGGRVASLLRGVIDCIISVSEMKVAWNAALGWNKGQEVSFGLPINGEHQ